MILVTVILVIHVVACLGLIAAVLLHSGRGAGLSSAFGGGLPSTFSGTSLIEKNLDRITIALAITFAITSVLLAIFLS